MIRKLAQNTPKSQLKSRLFHLKIVSDNSFIKPSIEFWFLIHYLNTNKHFNTSDDVIEVLRKYIPDFSKQEKFLSQERLVANMISEDRLKQACQRAESMGIEGASYSNVYKAFAIFEKNG